MPALAPSQLASATATPGESLLGWRPGREGSCFSQALRLRLLSQQSSRFPELRAEVMVHKPSKAGNVLCLRRNDSVLSVGVEL